MWPLYVLFNKAFGTEEDRIPEREHSNFFKSFLREQPSVKGKSFGSVLRLSHFVEVSALKTFPVSFADTPFGILTLPTLLVKVKYLPISLKFLNAMVLTGSAHKSAIFLGLWPRLYSDGFQNCWHQQPQHRVTRQVMLHYEVFP